LIAFVRDGDTVIAHSMDRLARNLDDLRRLVRTLTGKGVRVEFVKEKPDVHRGGLADGHAAAVGHGRLRRV
jgi:DNA invertase Pin-like site-specific DNA recombinase